MQECRVWQVGSFSLDGSAVVSGRILSLFWRSFFLSFLCPNTQTYRCKSWKRPFNTTLQDMYPNKVILIDSCLASPVKLHPGKESITSFSVTGSIVILLLLSETFSNIQRPFPPPLMYIPHYILMLKSSILKSDSILFWSVMKNDNIMANLYLRLHHFSIISKRFHMPN